MEVQKENMEPMVQKVTDMGIMLECLHEVYGTEEEQLLSGKSLRSTMAYPFIKMIGDQCKSLPPKKLHRILWGIYREDKEKYAFIKAAKEQLTVFEKGVKNNAGF